ncbi:MAG TPA: hypothetical protein VG757_00570 [Devosia sp.]|nr:hypothetical protein [Devosia sp.]
MANLALDTGWTAPASHPVGVLGATVRRLRALVRFRRASRRRRATLRLLRGESRDPRMLADIGLDPRRHATCDWVEAMARSMSGR